MVSYSFCDKNDMSENVNAIPIEEILGQYRKRFCIDTHIGTIVLKYLPYRMKKAIDVMRNIRYSNIKELEEELRLLYPLVAEGCADKEQIDKINKITSELRPSLDMYMLGCVEYPFISNMDELDALLDALTEEEREHVQAVMEIMAAPCPETIDAEYLFICDRFKVPIVDRELMQNITLQEYDALNSILKHEAEEMKKAYRKMGVNV